MINTGSRQLAAIMFTDMVGYTALMQQNEQLAVQKRERCIEIFEASLKKFDGKLLMYYGDGTLSIFSSAVNAVKSAIEIQTLNLQEPKIDVRIGLHMGDVMFDQTGIYGDSVNVASRIETLAVPGAVFVSEKLYEEIKNQEGMLATPLGYFELKNVKEPMQVYAISNHGIVVPSREEVKGKVKQTLNSIAVLPFASLSADPDNEYFCDGMTEELINVLSKVNGLQVTSRTSAFAFKGKNSDIREIAARLNVQKLIEGSVRKAGNRIRITAQLINAADGYHFWSETYDRNLEDIFEIQDDIARVIANKLRENLTNEQHHSTLTKAPTENLEAYKKYLRAIQLMDRANQQQRELSLRLLKEAIALDPAFSNASAYLGVIYAFMAQTGQLDAGEALKIANNYVSQSLQAEPENPIALAALSTIRIYEWQWDEGFQILLKALEINPNLSILQLVASEYYLLFMKPEKELEHAVKNYELDPLSANSIGEAARHFMINGKPEEAIKLCDEALQIDAYNLVSRNIKAFALTMTGKPDEAIKILNETYQMIGDFPLLLMAIALTNKRLGEEEKVNAVIDKLEQMRSDNPGKNLDFVLALIYANTGNIGKALEAYDHGLERKALWIVQWYGTELMRPLWYEPKIVASRKKLGLPVKELAAGSLAPEGIAKSDTA